MSCSVRVVSLLKHRQSRTHKPEEYEVGPRRDRLVAQRDAPTFRTRHLASKESLLSGGPEKSVLRGSNSHSHDSQTQITWADPALPHQSPHKQCSRKQTLLEPLGSYNPASPTKLLQPNPIITPNTARRYVSNTLNSNRRVDCFSRR